VKKTKQKWLLRKSRIVSLWLGKSYTTSSYWTPPGRERSKGRWS